MNIFQHDVHRQVDYSLLLLDRLQHLLVKMEFHIFLLSWQFDDTFNSLSLLYKSLYLSYHFLYLVCFILITSVSHTMILFQTEKWISIAESCQLPSFEEMNPESLVCGQFPLALSNMWQINKLSFRSTQTDWCCLRRTCHGIGTKCFKMYKADGGCVMKGKEFVTLLIVWSHVWNQHFAISFHAKLYHREVVVWL